MILVNMYYGGALKLSQLSKLLTKSELMMPGVVKHFLLLLEVEHYWRITHNWCKSTYWPKIMYDGNISDELLQGVFIKP